MVEKRNPRRRPQNFLSEYREEITGWCLEGSSTREIAAKFGSAHKRKAHHSTIARWLKKWGIE